MKDQKTPASNRPESKLRLLAALVILAWMFLFYLQFERPYIIALSQNLSPLFLFSFLLHQFFWLSWLTLPLLVLAWKRGRYFCWRLCPIGLLQDLLPSAGQARLTSFNRAVFLFLAGFSLFSLNLAAFFDPLVTFNRAVVAFSLRLSLIAVFLLPLGLICASSLWKRRWWCYQLCPLGALIDWIDRRKKGPRTLDLGRRRTLLLLGGGILAGATRRAIFSSFIASSSSRLIRPPGARPESDFRDLCLRCGSCLAVCPTGGLQPDLSESGLSGLFTPRLIPRLGECLEDCNRCGQSCPSQAIGYLPLDRKRNFKMGMAKVFPGRCLSWALDIECLDCQRACPYGAIEARPNRSGTPSPVVSSRICRGCGRCEKYCPVKPTAAIVVFNLGAGETIKEIGGER